MNVRIPVICWMFFFLVMPLKVRADDVKDSKMHSIRVQLLLVESSGNLDQDERRRLSGSGERVMNAIRELTDQGKITIVNHAELTVLEGQQAMLQVGETVSLRTGSLRTGSGRESKVYQDVNIGTLIKLMTKVVEDHVLIELDFSKSFVTPGSDNLESELPQGTSQLTHQSTLRIKNGSAQMIGRMMSRQSGDQRHAIQMIVAADILDSSETGQVTRFRSNSQQPSRSAPASGRPVGRSSSRSLSPLNSEEARRRFATAMFDRADANKDGEISKSELPRLSARDFKAKPPIKKAEYLEWMSSRWPPSGIGRGPSSSNRRPGSFRSQTQPRDSDAKEKTGGERGVGDSESKDDEDVKAAKEQRHIGDTQIEVVPELGTIIVRGSKSDVERVLGVIKQIDPSAVRNVDVKDGEKGGE